MEGLGCMECGPAKLAPSSASEKVGGEVLGADGGLCAGRGGRACTRMSDVRAHACVTAFVSSNLRVCVYRSREQATENKSRLKRYGLGVSNPSSLTW